MCRGVNPLFSIGVYSGVTGTYRFQIDVREMIGFCLKEGLPLGDQRRCVLRAVLRQTHRRGYGELMKFMKLLSLGAFGLSIAWMIFEPGFEPLITMVVTFIATGTAMYAERNLIRNQQQQKVASNSQAYQAGRDINIGQKSE